MVTIWTKAKHESKRNCFDNAVVESFSHTLKTHIIHDFYYKTRKLANKALFEYIEIYYNRIPVIQPMAGYHLNNMNNNITKTKK
ncbi:IS3 family transposase [Gilliamella sp. ESL0250]|uniref:IS3 family transposase n=1 Tax=Gilliamella sp. ESL0250 TaxID=2705036 RepID=UPI0015803B69|nr:IS3 family transposase [Gilliamella sp. ESL0250]